ncbi:unnamed protein product [Nippostrongylus brasiliensis]|uniref:Secreted frizzled-related protein 5-like n=1 Tax=Nippostrongylus brasiliensis TaxID=27835 RepID=A0A0N4XUL4_NIPBR|nr:unnamed protein product [Nippostrongylus brasiliensis]
MSRVSLLLAALLSTRSSASAYLSDSWMLSSERPMGPRCVPIPQNLTICYGMQYNQMRLPNLLEHDTINEAIHQSSDWKSLLQLNCHPDTQLFLCSLFAPICLPTMDKEILPCRSLCNAVKQGCEGRMSVYGFPWPEMLSCEKYPEDNDMCIKAMNGEKQGKLARPMHGQSVALVDVHQPFLNSNTKQSIIGDFLYKSAKAPLIEEAMLEVSDEVVLSVSVDGQTSPISARDISCPACVQVGTYENLVDHFCRSQLGENCGELAILNRDIREEDLLPKETRIFSVLKTKIVGITGTHVSLRNARSLKKGDRRRSIDDTDVRLSTDSAGCPCNVTDGGDRRFLVMASKGSDGQFVANLILPWKKEKNFKRAVHQFQRLNCKSLGREIRESASRRPHFYSMRRHNQRQVV